MYSFCFFFQAEDGIRDLVRSRGLGDVYKRQADGYAGFGALYQGEVIEAACWAHARRKYYDLYAQLSLIHI